MAVRKKGKIYYVKVGNRVIARVRKLPSTIKVVAKQSGTRASIQRDRDLKALPPGKRVSRTGKIYYEYRKNRSDKKGTRI